MIQSHDQVSDNLPNRIKNCAARYHDRIVAIADLDDSRSWKIKSRYASSIPTHSWHTKYGGHLRRLSSSGHRSGTEDNRDSLADLSTTGVGLVWQWDTGGEAYGAEA